MQPYNPAPQNPRAPTNARETNLRRIDNAAMRKRNDKQPMRGQSAALPGVPQLPVAGLPNNQPAQQPAQQQQAPAQQSAQQQQQQGQMQLPSHVGGAMGQMIPRGGGGFPDGAQIPQGPQAPMLPPSGAQGVGTPSNLGFGMVPIGPPEPLPQETLPGAGGMQSLPGQGGPGLAGGNPQVPPPLQMPAPQPLPGGQDPSTPKVGGLPGGPAGAGSSGAAAGTGAPAGGDPYADERSQYESLIEQAKADEQAAMQGIDADIARAQRRQAEMNAAMGGAVGGGLMGGMATTATLGARERAEAQVAAREKTRNLQLGWLDRQLELKERDINRKFSREMSDKDKAHQLELEAARMGIELSPEFQDALDRGDYDEAMSIHERESGGAGGSADAGVLTQTTQGGEEFTAYHAGSTGSVYGSGDYSSDNYNHQQVSGGSQSWSYGSGDSVNGAMLGTKIQDLLERSGADPSVLSRITSSNGPSSQGGLRFIGNTDEGREFMAWAAWFVDNTGEQPDRSDILEKLYELGVHGLGRPGSVSREEYAEATGG